LFFRSRCFIRSASDPTLACWPDRGAVWIAALLAAILPLDRLIEPDIEAGLFDQWPCGLSEEALVLVRIAAHWISFQGPLLLGDPIAAA
jgi:heme exporter protein B